MRRYGHCRWLRNETAERGRALGSSHARWARGAGVERRARLRQRGRYLTGLGDERVDANEGVHVGVACDPGGSCGGRESDRSYRDGLAVRPPRLFDRVADALITLRASFRTWGVRHGNVF
jgi:hypothetical protein